MRASYGKRIARSGFDNYLHYVQIPHSHAEGYRFSDTGEDYLVGALARINLNRDLLHPRTKATRHSLFRPFPRTTSTTTTWHKRSRSSIAWTMRSTSREPWSWLMSSPSGPRARPVLALAS